MTTGEPKAIPPWEETWTADGDLVVGPSFKADFEGDPLDPNDYVAAEARAELAAQAPAMARLLLQLEWKGESSFGSGECCVDCGGLKERGHVKECELVPVLRNAGVIP